MSVTPTANPPTFEQLIDFVNDVVELIDRVIDMTIETGQFRPDAANRLFGVRGLTRIRADVVIQQIQSGQYDRALIEHDLHDGDPAWRFKSQGYASARRDYDEWMSAGRPTELADPPNLPWWKKWARKAKKPLAWANVILRSVAAAVPGGGALNEIKDGVEATVDQLDD